MRIIIPHTSYVMMTSESKVLSFLLRNEAYFPHSSYVVLTSESKFLYIIYVYISYKLHMPDFTKKFIYFPDIDYVM